MTTINLHISENLYVLEPLIFLESRVKVDAVVSHTLKFEKQLQWQNPRISILSQMIINRLIKVRIPRVHNL